MKTLKEKITNLKGFFKKDNDEKLTQKSSETKKPVYRGVNYLNSFNSFL